MDGDDESSAYDYQDYDYWYHLASAGDLWDDSQLQAGLTNWAYVMQGAYMVAYSSFINTTKCRKTKAMINILRNSQVGCALLEGGGRGGGGGGVSAVVVVVVVVGWWYGRWRRWHWWWWWW